MINKFQRKKFNQVLQDATPLRLDAQNCRTDYTLAHEFFAFAVVSKTLISLNIPEDEANILAQKFSGTPERRFEKCIKERYSGHV